MRKGAVRSVAPVPNQRLARSPALELACAGRHRVQRGLQSRAKYKRKGRYLLLGRQGRFLQALNY